MKSHGFRIVVLLVCTIYHGGLLLLLNLKQPECQRKSHESSPLSADIFDVVHRNSFNNSIDNSINGAALDIRDGITSNASKLSIQPLEINREGAATRASIGTETPEPASSSKNKSANIPVDRGAWLVICVTR